MVAARRVEIAVTERRFNGQLFAAASISATSTNLTRGRASDVIGFPNAGYPRNLSMERETKPVWH